MQFDDSLALFNEYLCSYCSSSTITYYNINLDMFLRFMTDRKGCCNFPVSELLKSDYISYISYQRSRSLKNTSVRTYARAVKVYLRWLWFEEYIDKNITVNVKVPKMDARIVNPLTTSEVYSLYSACSSTSLSLRNLLIVSLMLECGLRSGEVCRLELSHIDSVNNILHICNSKGCKSRDIPVSDYVIGLFLDYRNTLSFKSKYAIVTVKGKQLTKYSIDCLFAKLKVSLNFNIYPHLLRHTFATSFILGGGSLEVLRVLLGHSSYSVTQNYLHISSQCSVCNLDVYQIDNCYFSAYDYHNRTT